MSYGRDILDDFEQQRRGPQYRTVPATPGLLVEDRASGFCGDVVKADARAVTLRDRNGNDREFLFKPGGFLLDGKPVTLARPAPAAAAGATAPKVTNSGSVAAASPQRARLAAASRIWVEGKHDAELVEHVWGDDLRELGIVVEPMHGLDDVVVMVREFQPGPDRRLGILVDHLVTGSKEHRLATQVAGPHVLVTGHPFVDVWAGVWPRVMGLTAWPEVPRNVPWKEGMCAALGTDLRGFWPRLRNQVRSYADLRPELVGAVEQLIDFVAPGD
ncbi:MAG: DUF3097 family protein [Actinomycetota bacterium]|nr:DUF3097 family protein [Actinomycetota bacterium]